MTCNYCNFWDCECEEDSEFEDEPYVPSLEVVEARKLFYAAQEEEREHRLKLGTLRTIRRLTRVRNLIDRSIKEKKFIDLQGKVSRMMRHAF